MVNKKEVLNVDGHISDMYICICADRLKEEREDLIPEEVRSHLEHCEACRNSVLDIYSTTLAPTEIPEPELSLFSSALPRRKPLTYRLAFRTAATFLILGFITVVYLMIDNKEPVIMMMTENKTDTVSVTSDTGNAGENLSTRTDKGRVTPKKGGNTTEIVHNSFKDNPNLEFMVNSRHRGRLIHIISPEFKVLGKGNILFMWKNHIDKDLELKILNNRNETLYKCKAEASKVEFKGNLPPGLYYWKLEDTENLYHVGKFIIEK